MNMKERFKPPHPGIYGEVAELLESIRSDVQTFKNAPLGPRQKNKLRKSISEQEARLRELRVKLAEHTEHVKNNRDFNPNLSCSVRHNDRVFRPLDGSVMCDACYWRKSVSMRKGRPYNVGVPQKA